MRLDLTSGAVVLMVISNLFLLRQVMNRPEPLTLTPEVKAYIDSKVSASADGTSVNDLNRMFQKIADLEKEAGKLENLQQVMFTFEENRLKLRAHVQDKVITSNEVLAQARSRELRRFRSQVDLICGEKAGVGKTPGKVGSPVFLQKPKGSK